MKKYFSGKFFKMHLIILIGISALCWDLTQSRMDIEPGTFRFESEFDAVSAATTKVSIVSSDYSELNHPVSRDTNPEYSQIEEMVGKAIELQGGLDWIIKKGDVVMIKVNLVGGSSRSGDGENTDVRIVKALIHHIHQFTEGEVTIQIAEGTARTNDDPTDPSSVWGNCGYIDLLSDTLMEGINLSLLNLNQSIDNMVEVDLGKKAMSAIQGTKYNVHQAELEADVYIAVPVLKIHNTGITNALKLQVGTAPGCYYGYNKTKGTEYCPDGLIHDVEHRRWTTEMIVDLSSIAQIDFVLVDAIMCLEISKGYKKENQVRFNTILAGTDPVAVDHISAKMMGLNPDDVAHITLAEKAGLGTNDPEYIEQTGVPLMQAMKIVKKSQASEGKFGQSNRTWILSQAFEGTDLSHTYFLNESEIEPVPGETGWSQPVYFFDDRIDLYSYYSGSKNIISYAFSYFNALKSQEAELWLGTHEGIKVFINGDQVHSSNTVNIFDDSDRLTSRDKIQIKKGKNTLLVKTVNKYGDYSFTLNICEVEDDPYYFGNRVEGLKFFIDPEGTGSIISSVPQNRNLVDSLTVYPNPAIDFTTLRFSLSEPGSASIKIHSLNGRLIKTFNMENSTKGINEIQWMLNDNAGNHVNPGTYLVNLEVEKHISTFKLVIK